MKKRILVGADPLGRPLKDEIVVYLEEEGYEAVSYTHLDVSKRQGFWELFRNGEPG